WGVLFPDRDAVAVQGLVRQVSGGRAPEPGLVRGAGALPGRDCPTPVPRLGPFAVRFVEKSRPFRPRAEYQLLDLAASALGLDLVAATVDVQARVATHEDDVRSFTGVEERPLEVGLHVLLPIHQQGLHRVRSLPETLADGVLPD